MSKTLTPKEINRKTRILQKLKKTQYNADKAIKETLEVEAKHHQNLKKKNIHIE